MDKRALIGAALLTPVVALVDLELVNWTAYGFVIWLCIPPAGLLLFVAGKVGKRRSAAAAGMAVLLAGLLGGVAAREVNLAKVTASKEVGDRIRAALEDHNAKTGRYPESLEDLVPEHFGEVPSTTMGVITTVPFLYSPSDEARGFGLRSVGPHRGAAERGASRSTSPGCPRSRSTPTGQPRW